MITLDKKCPACGATKKANMFNINSNTKTGLSLYCTSCSADRKKAPADKAFARELIILDRISMITLLKNDLMKGLKGTGLSYDVEPLIGCTLLEFKDWIQAHFKVSCKNNLSWGTFNIDGWLLGYHVHPREFNLTTIIGLRKACHYKNFRPQIYNHKKSRVCRF